MLDLVTIAEYKEYAKISSTEQDDKLNLLIPAVSSLIKNYCGKTFIDHAVTATTEYSSDGGLFIYTREQPIITVTSVSTRADPWAAYYALTVDVDYTIDIPNDYIYCLFSVDGFYIAPNATKIIYTGGFVDTPEDLKLGVLDLIQFYIKGEAQPRKSLNSNQISIEHIKSTDFPPHIKRVLELYRIH